MKSAPSIVVQFVHLQGPLKGEIQEFCEALITIGRHPSSVLKFPPDLAIVSRKHAEIIRDGNRFKLVDVSVNGTYVNGKRVKEVYLKSGDVLTFAEGGPKVSFLTQMKESEPVAARQAPVAPPPEREEIRPVAREQRMEQPPKVYEPEPPSDQPVNMPFVFQYGPTLRSFKQLPVQLGRHPSCQIRIEHPALLDMHLQIFHSQGRYWVKDLTGRDMVSINGQPVGIQAPLNPGDILSLSPKGPVFRFLGEGRLAEETEPGLPVNPPDAPGRAEKEERAEQEGTKENQERKSLFRKFLK